MHSNQLLMPDFGKSYLTFRNDWQKMASQTASHKPPFSLNNARIQIESSCHMTDRRSGEAITYVLGASCKTEYVGVERDIWTEPNADFCIILSPTHYLILKSWDRNNKGVMLYPESLGEQPERQSGLNAETYDETRVNLRMHQVRRLITAAEIIEATLSNEPLVGRVSFAIRDRYDVAIDFPIKTMNANERDDIYQTDTGPILFPDFTLDDEEPIETFRLAYVAFNTLDWAELLLQVPTSLTTAISANHYSRSVRLDSKNEIFALI